VPMQDLGEGGSYVVPTMNLKSRSLIGLRGIL
jgi:hypothetical protein